MTSNSYATQIDHRQYLMDSSNKIVEKREGGRLNQSIIIKYADQSEWVFLNNKGAERFCGFLYLEAALKDSGLDKVKAAANKMAMHERKIIYLSQYCGEEKPDFFDQMKQLMVLKNTIGFIDIAGGANLRKVEDQILVFDTEKGSFDPSVHEKIDSFVQQHAAIRTFLEQSLAE